FVTDIVPAGARDHLPPTCPGRCPAGVSVRPTQWFPPAGYAVSRTSTPGLLRGASLLRSGASFRGANGRGRRDVPPDVPVRGGGVSVGSGNDLADLPAGPAVTI